MDTRFCAQDIIRCDICQDSIALMYCNLCPLNLCKGCVGEHISDVSKKHDVVPFELRSRLVYPQCQTHSEEYCEMHCEDCNISACSKCLISEKHTRHHFRSLQDLVNSKKDIIEKERMRLQERVYSKFENRITEIKHELGEIEGEYEKLASEVTKHGEEWHREIDKVIQKNKEDIEQMRRKHRETLNKHLNDMKMFVADVEQTMSEMNENLKSKEVSKTLSYEINPDKFKKLPPKLTVEFPVFTLKNSQRQCFRLFGSISPLSISKEEYGYSIETPEAVSCPPVKQLLDEAEPIITIDTGYRLYSVACLSDEEIWTCGNDKIIKLYNLQGKLLKSIKTKSGNKPFDIAATKSGDLFYIDRGTRTVNMVKNKQIQEVIRLQGWIPYNVCNTSSGDLLVTMNSDDGAQSKAVRYSGSTEKQTIQFDSKGQPLYSSGFFTKYISENRNRDICVADWGANAIVVVNKAGKLRFRYTGHPTSTKGSFCPYSITTNSQSQILTADFNNNCIHVLDQDGYFFRYVDKLNLYHPRGLCVDTKDNLFVAECYSGKVKKIEYT
ncbi:uncharacterized protein LOC133203361 [Saccostrea echinata]|uniref:uncharacterized protein LOC133203361 n=1 Tax=Saccostrea echinata TaxID=191078 RepID=UPI002A7F2111|nr:uncharacterized protein LOC133203361 [Saccostrea echinata]